MVLFYHNLDRFNIVLNHQLCIPDILIISLAQMIDFIQ